MLKASPGIRSYISTYLPTAKLSPSPTNTARQCASGARLLLIASPVRAYFVFAASAARITRRKFPPQIFLMSSAE
jgi:hypothetical protein